MTDNHPGPVVALVAAAGSGSRLGGGTPKALRRLAGIPLVSHSVARLAAGGVQRAVVIVPAGLDGQFHAALGAAPIPYRLVTGGPERQQSVRLGLQAAGDATVVLVHDAARPLVPPDLVAAVIASVRAGQVAVVPALPVVDSIRRVTEGGSAVVDRAPLRGVQTPQGFAYATLVEAHDHVERLGLEVTDDASCCEAAGYPVELVTGSRLAMKVTEPADLVIAEALFAAYADELTVP